MSRRGRELALLLPVLAAVVAVLFRDSLFGGAVLTQADALYLFEPWRSVAPEGFVPGNGLLLDQARGFLPWNDFVAERLRAGELPLWCPYNYAGIPLVGTCQSAIYWPLHWLYYAWPEWGTYVWIAAAKLLLAGTFAFLFLRRLAVTALAAAVGALGFALCGFMVAWLNHPHSNVALALPALLWAVERVAARGGGRDVALFGLLVGLQLLGGHLQTSLHVALLVAAWIALRLAVPVSEPATRLTVRRAGWLAGAALLGAALAAPQILPVLEYLGHSQAARVFSRPDLVASEGIGRGVLLMVDPDRFGAPHTHDYAGPSGPNLNYNELIGGYVGRVLLVCAVLGLALGRRSGRPARVVFFALTVAVAGLVAWQVDPFHAVFRALPGLQQTKLMRFLLFVAFGLTVLGAIGLDAVLARLRGGARRLAGATAFVAVAVELLLFADGYNPEVDPALLLPRTRTTDFLSEQDPQYRALALDNTALAPNANTFYRVPMISGYDSVEDRAYAELVLRMTEDPPEFPFVSQIAAFDRVAALPLASLLGARWILTDGALPPPLQRVRDAEIDVWENPMAMPKAFLAADVRVIEDPEERLAWLSSAAFDPRVAVLEEASAAYEHWRRAGGGDPAGTVELVAQEPRYLEMRVATDAPALLVVNDLDAPGWEATAGGEELEIVRVDHALRGVWLPPGEHRVAMRYAPASTTIGLLAGAAALLGLALVAVRLAPRAPPGIS